MSPATRKLFKQLVRLLKGMITAFDKWIDEKGKEA